ncbi:MAG: hypothetical protein AAF716_09755 [Cyanobacteria bacterium P01_D01_bin.1]
MISISTKQPTKIMRWLSPLLLVSLGLHGLGLLIPVPRKAEVLNEPEELSLESIPVSMLPAEPLPEMPVVELPPPPEPDPTPEISLPAPPAVSASPPPPAVEAPPIQPEPEPTPSPEPTSEPASEPVTSTEALESNKPIKPDSLEPQELRSEGTQSENLASFMAFQTIVAGVDEEMIADPIRRENYELDYLQGLCFPDVERVTGSVGVIFDGASQLYAAKAITSTRIDAVDAAVEKWFDSLKQGENSTAEIETTFDQSLHEWTTENGQQSIDTENSGYKAYTFEIDVNLLDNC